MKEIGIKEYRYKLKTPVHVGSGEKLGQMDFIFQGYQCIVVDIDSLMEELKDNTRALNEFADGRFNIADFLKQYKISPESVQKYAIRNPDNIRSGYVNIQENIKTGMCNPIIPGSSIKGAIRTALLWYLLQSMDKSQTNKMLHDVLKSDVKKEKASSSLDKEIFGPNPNDDFLRGLHVGDVEFQMANMKLLESKVLNIDNSNSYGWKKMGRDGFTSPNHQKATSIFCEALGEGSTATGRLKIDKFLFENPSCEKELGFLDKKGLLDRLSDRCNDFARVFIDSEIEFFENCKMQVMVNFYNDIRNEIPEDNKAFLLHLGWGTGWKSMTGNWIDDEILLKFRARFDLGKSICPKCGEQTKSDKKKKGFSYCFSCKDSHKTNMHPIFPKSRKIAFHKGQPIFPFGWIRVERLLTDEVDSAGFEKTSKPEPIPQSEFKTNFEEFRLKPSPENFRTFIEKIKSEQIPDLEELSFKSMKDSVNIGFVTPLLESNISAGIKKVLAVKLLEIIKPRKKWNSDKVNKYKELEKIAGI